MVYYLYTLIYTNKVMYICIFHNYTHISNERNCKLTFLLKISLIYYCNYIVSTSCPKLLCITISFSYISKSYSTNKFIIYTKYKFYNIRKHIV